MGKFALAIGLTLIGDSDAWLPWARSVPASQASTWDDRPHARDHIQLDVDSQLDPVVRCVQPRMERGATVCRSEGYLSITHVAEPMRAAPGSDLSMKIRM
jgi:hypothetical protein